MEDILMVEDLCWCLGWHVRDVSWTGGAGAGHGMGEQVEGSCHGVLLLDIA